MTSLPPKMKYRLLLATRVIIFLTVVSVVGLFIARPDIDAIEGLQIVGTHLGAFWTGQQFAKHN